MRNYPLRILWPQCMRKVWVIFFIMYSPIPVIPWYKWPFNLGIWITFSKLMYILQYPPVPCFYFPHKIFTEIFCPIKVCMKYSNHETLLVTNDYRCVSESQSSEHSYSSFPESLWVSWVFRRPWYIITLPCKQCCIHIPTLISSPFS